MNETDSNSADKPWREVLQLESAAPTEEMIHEHFRLRVKDADAERRAVVNALNRARAAAFREVWPEAPVVQEVWSEQNWANR